MTPIDTLRLALSQGPARPGEIMEKLQVSQPTLSRLINSAGSDVLRIGAAKSIQYVWRDGVSGLDPLTVYGVNATGQIIQVAHLTPVRPDGFVVREASGRTHFSPGLPWWLLDQRPQGFLGRAFAARHAESLRLDARVDTWSDRQALRALLLHGLDGPGHWVLGDLTRQRLLNADPGEPISAAVKGEAYAELATVASQGGQAGSSAGGEQPKFAAWATTRNGPQHVLVKFSWSDDNPVTQRWRDLLLAEHLALEVLREEGLAAASSALHDHAGQRFLELERFDRIGPQGRRALYSLAALDSEFVGKAFEPWPVVMAELAAQRIVRPSALEISQRLHAFGVLIGNNDMHAGNLSLMDEGDNIECPRQPKNLGLAPAYDMLPMALAPRSSGALPTSLPNPYLHPAVDHRHWRPAWQAARRWLERLRHDRRLSAGFHVGLQSLSDHLDKADTIIARLG